MAIRFSSRIKYKLILVKFKTNWVQWVKWVFALTLTDTDTPYKNIYSFEQVWPDTVVKCCFFYLTQNIWRKVESKGMQSDYSQSEQLAIRIRLLPALAFAAPHEVHPLFHSVVQQLPMPQQPVWSYISKRPISGEHSQGTLTKRHLFPFECGTIISTHLSEHPGQLISLRHIAIIPLWKFIDSLKREQGLVEVRQAKFISGAQPLTDMKSQANE